LITTIVHSLATFVWGWHWFPYSSSKDGKRKWRRSYITRPTIIYSREGGQLKEKVEVGKGFVVSSLIYLALVVYGFLILVMIDLSLPIAAYVVTIIYTIYFSIVTIFVFPETFLVFTKLPGKLSGLIAARKPDAPLSPMIMAFLLSYLTTLVLFKQLGDPILQRIIENSFIMSLEGAKFVCGSAAAIVVVMTIALLRSTGREAPSTTLYCFMASWVLSALWAFILLILFSL